ncbi:MAG: response regulator [Cyanobacteria bacterium SZAS-4]|nr:response regulator [Cyanobacteria bacterium SZAS-4]
MENNIEILLVEDTPSDVRLTQEALKRSGLKYTMSVVNDGVEAMDYLNERKSGGQKMPDLILLDLNMPRKNGHEVLADVQADKDLSKIPVVLLTVSQRDEDVQEALKLKMNYYLAKPVTAQNLTVLVKSIYELNTDGDAKDAKADPSAQAHVHYVLAGNPHTSPMVLTKLADDSAVRVRARVAENPETPAEVLLRLAGDDNADVRLAVTENEKAPHLVLERLAKDASEDVRLGIASNPKIPSEILALLLDDENMFVSSKAKETLSTLSTAK